MALTTINSGLDISNGLNIGATVDPEGVELDVVVSSGGAKNRYHISTIST